MYRQTRYYLCRFVTSSCTKSRFVARRLLQARSARRGNDVARRLKSLTRAAGPPTGGRESAALNQGALLQMKLVRLRPNSADRRADGHPKPSVRAANRPSRFFKRSPTSMFQITNEWLEEFQSKKDGWTRIQLAAIGVDWPPLQGWKKAAAGRTISDEDRLLFEGKSPRQNGFSF